MIEPSERIKKVMKLQIIAAVINTVWALFTASFFVDLFLAGVGPSEDGGFFLRLTLTFLGTWFLAKWLNNFSLSLINAYVYKGDFRAAAEDALEFGEQLRREQHGTPDDFIDASVEELKEELRQREAIANGTMFVIKDMPPAPVAKFMDADIYEWLDVQLPNGQVRRASFEGTINLQQGLPKRLEPDMMLVPPGILYKLAPSQ